MYRGLPSAHRDNLPVATEASRKVLCLPIYPALEERQVQRIVEQIVNPTDISVSSWQQLGAA
jgi:dTDP-4-amino-4,6-dideoxygalactose transaminase